MGRSHVFCTAGLFVSQQVSHVLDVPCVRIYRGSYELYNGESIESEWFRNRLSQYIHRPIVYNESDPYNAYVFVDKKGSRHWISTISKIICKYNV